MDFRMYVIVNKDLKMSKGKVAAQVAHAVARLNVKDAADTCIVLQATTEQIRNLGIYLALRGIKSHQYIDEGANEVPPYSITAMAVRPIDELDTKAIETFKNLELLK